MEIQINHKVLSKALTYASRAVSQKPNIPILSNVMLKVDKSSVEISATNLDMGIHMWIPGKVETAGSTTVNAKYISDFVSASSENGESLTLSLKENSVNVITASSKGTFSTMPAEEYPVLPTAKTLLFKIACIEFIKSMNKTLFACSTDLSSGRIQQSGVLFEISQEKSEVNFVGLDGFRLSKRISQVKEAATSKDKSEIIVPARYLMELVKILADYPNIENLEVYLSETNSQLVFKFEDTEFSVRLLEGPYPDYKRIMPNDYSFTFEIKKKEIENAIKIVNTFARGNLGNKTLFDFDVEQSKITLSSVVTDVGEGSTHIAVTNASADTDLNTAYTLRYLQDVVNHLEGDKIIFESKGPLAASVFKDNDDPQFVHLVMPMRRDS